MQLLRFLSGPVIGAVIGYFTNYLAVKMLFRPYRPVMIGRFRLPLTPGIIPKRQADLADAVGKAISESLFTGGDLRAMLINPETEAALSEKLLEDGKTAGSLLSAVLPPERTDALMDKAADKVSAHLISAAAEMDIGQKLAAIGGEVIREKKRSLGMLSMFLSDETFAPLLASFAEKVNRFIADDAAALCRPAVLKELNKIKDRPLSELFGDRKTLASALCPVYEAAVDALLSGLSADTRIAEAVSGKIRAMDVRELEALCLSVMQKELRAIVNLGFVIGFFIGLLNNLI